MRADYGRLAIERPTCHPDTAVWVLVDDEYLATIWLDEQEGSGSDLPEWCMSFFLPNSGRLSTMAHVFDDAPPYESIEQAVPRVLEEALDWDFSEAPERSSRLKQAIREVDFDDFRLPAVEPRNR